MLPDELLKSLGLSKSETTIYLSLLSNGPCPIKDIVQATGLNRTYIHDRIKRLQKKGYITSSTVDGRNVFQASDPKRIESEIHYIADEISKVLSLAHRKPSKPACVETYLGKDGVKMILSDILEKKKEVLILGYSRQVEPLLSHYYPNYQMKIRKLRIRRKIISDRRFHFEDKLTECRTINRRELIYGGVWVYDDSVVIFLPENEIHTIAIRSQMAARLFSSYFKILWKSAKK